MDSTLTLLGLLCYNIRQKSVQRVPLLGLQDTSALHET